jgi:hypothetical protein
MIPSTIDSTPSNIPSPGRLGARYWQWLVVVLLGATGWVAALLLLRTRIGSGEQLSVVLSVMLLAWLFIRILRSRGTFRFLSLLIATAVVAWISSIVIPPLRQRVQQQNAIARILSKGGEVQTWPLGTYRRMENHLGWSRAPSGWMIPAPVMYAYLKWLSPQPIGNVAIPSSSFDDATLQMFTGQDVPTIDIVLDGAVDHATSLNAFLAEYPPRVLDEPTYFYSTLNFRVRELGEKDIRFLNTLRTSTLVLKIDLESARLDRLANVAKPMVLMMQNMPSNPNELNALATIEQLNEIQIVSSALDPNLFAALDQRPQRFLKVSLDGCVLTKGQWDWFCATQSIQSLVLQNVAIGNRPLQSADVEQLAKNHTLHRLTLSEYSSAVPLECGPLFQMQGLQALYLAGRIAVTAPSEDVLSTSKLRSVRIRSTNNILPEPWMKRIPKFSLDE